MLTSYVPLLVVFAVAAALAAVFLAAARLLGPRRHSPEKDRPYESGLDPEHATRARFHVNFYRVGLLFLVFDLEVAFFYPWAVLYRDLSCREPLRGGLCHAAASFYGLGIMLPFLALLVLGLAYEWKKGALAWR